MKLLSAPPFLFITALLLPGSPTTVDAQDVSIGYLALDLDDASGPGGDYWEYQYRVSDPGAVLGPEVSFSIHFPPAGFQNMESPPPFVHTDWDATVFQPLTGLLSDGVYDGKPWVVSPSLTETFSVRFIWQGGPGTTPGGQAFDINSYDGGGSFLGVLQSGMTTPGFPLSALEAWRQLHFGSPANSGNGANQFDFDGDGLENLVEFAFGLNPVLGGSLQLPEGRREGGEYVISFPTPPGVSGITCGAEWSTSLEEGTWWPVPDTGTAPLHTFSVPDSTERLFLRLTVTVP
jgi:hypothetical protein